MLVFLKKYFSLSGRRKRLAWITFVLTLCMRIGLAWCPLKKLVNFVERQSPGKQAPYSLEEIIWAVRAMDRRLPFATCLVNGLVARYLCSRNNISSCLLIGVKKGQASELEAHAWVSVGDQIVIGEVDDLDTYVTLPPLSGKS